MQLRFHHMSKAFTKESDDQAQYAPIVPRVNSALPPGAANYMTADGAGEGFEARGWNL